MGWWSPSRTWRSGPWSLSLRADELADIAFDGRTALRSVRAVVRDRDWDTAPLLVDRIRETDSTLTLHVHSEALGSSFRGVVRVEARAGGLVVIADLESEQAFETNRTGLVVLHPPTAAGSALRVVHGDGAIEETAFPTTISPHQPVFDIAELAWMDAGLEVGVRFAGDVFEMEDQRNWTDASFKTYSRPLALPFPYAIGAGDRIVQTLVISARTAGAVDEGSPDTVVVLRHAGGPVPGIGVGASTAPDPAPTDVPAVGDALLVEVDLGAPNALAALERAATSGARLDVRLVLTDDDGALDAAIAALASADLVRVAAFQPPGSAAEHMSDADATARLRTALATAARDVPVFGGARSHFTELNREQHRLPDDLDGVVFSVTPLFHSLGTEQLVESLAMQRLVATQAVGIAGGAPVAIGPITLRPHFNNVATTPAPASPHADLRDGYGPALLDAADERQSSDELAAWTIASAAALAVPGVTALSFFEEWGPGGIHDSSGAPRPVAAALTALHDLSGGELLTADTPDGLLWAIGAVAPDGSESVLVANVGAEARTLRVTTPTGHAGIHLGPSTWLRVPTRP